MADSENMDVTKLKVADLKKELKSRGQPVSGNKTELIERLQACLGAGDVVEDVDDKLLDEEDSTLEDDTVADASTEADLTQPEPSTTKVEAETRATETEKQESTVKVNELTDVERQKLRASKFGVVSDEQKKLLRAEKFGLAAGATKENDDTKKLARADRFNIVDADAKKLARAERFGIQVSTTTTTTAAAATTGKTATAPMTDKMKQRMERFGIVTSGTQNTDSDKLLKRKEKFSVNSGLDDAAEKKRKRAERFGLS